MNIKSIAKNIYWSAYGKTFFNPKLPENIKSILFVCFGNICRSPFAEKIAILFTKGVKIHNISSAGIQGVFPRTSPVEAIEAAKIYGVDLHGHQSQKLDIRMMESFDVVIVMDVWQYNHLKQMYKDLKSKIFLLPLFEDRKARYDNDYFMYNIKDPYGNSLSDFVECYRRIVNCTYVLMNNINGT